MEMHDNLLTMLLFLWNVLNLIIDRKQEKPAEVLALLMDRDTLIHPGTDLGY